MATPILLTQASAGAPVLSGEAGSLYTIFKWALPQLGWTVEYDDPATFRVAFRNDPVLGSGSYFQIWDRGDDHFGASYNHMAAIRIFSAMTALDTGTDQFPDTAVTINNTSNYCFRKATSNNFNSRPLPYFIWGTDRGFYYCVNGGAASDTLDYIHWIGFVGDLVPYDGAVSPCFALKAGGGSNYYNVELFDYALSVTSETQCMDFCGCAVSHGVGGSARRLVHVSDVPGLGGSGGAFGIGSNSILSPVYKDEAYYVRIKLKEYPGSPSPTNVPVDRGYFPGVFGPIGDWESLYPQVSGQTNSTGKIAIPNLTKEGGVPFTGTLVRGGVLAAAGSESFMYSLLFDFDGDWYD